MLIDQTSPFIYQLVAWLVVCVFAAAFWHMAGVMQEIAIGSRVMDRRWMRLQKRVFRGYMPFGAWRSESWLKRVKLAAIAIRVFVILMVLVTMLSMFSG